MSLTCRASNLLDVCIQVGQPMGDFRWQEVLVVKPHRPLRCRHQDLDVSIPQFHFFKVCRLIQRLPVASRVLRTVVKKKAAKISQ